MPGSSWGAIITFSAGGDFTAASIQATVDAYRAALGNPNNGNAPGPLATGRREINWDGGGNAVSPAGTPFVGFLNNRGASFSTPGPGTGFVQAPPTGAVGGLDTFFGNPTYATIFSVFSQQRLFAPDGSNVTDVLFFVPGTNGGAAATVSGFGAVFTDVDLANTTSIQLFDINNSSLGTFFVAPGVVPSGSLSFLGLQSNAGEQIFRVRITTGTTGLGPTDNPGGGVDLVVLDDLLFAEPQQIVPEPSSFALFGLGLLALFGAHRRRKAPRPDGPANSCPSSA